MKLTTFEGVAGGGQLAAVYEPAHVLSVVPTASNWVAVVAATEPLRVMFARYGGSTAQLVESMWCTLIVGRASVVCPPGTLRSQRISQPAPLAGATLTPISSEISLSWPSPTRAFSSLRVETTSPLRPWTVTVQRPSTWTEPPVSGAAEARAPAEAAGANAVATTMAAANVLGRPVPSSSCDLLFSLVGVGGGADSGQRSPCR